MCDELTVNLDIVPPTISVNIETEVELKYATVEDVVNITKEDIYNG